MSTETEALGQMVPPENTLQPGVAVGNNAEATSRAMVGIASVDLIADADRVLLPTEYVCNVLVITDSGTVLTGPIDIEYPALFPRQTVTNNTAETLTLRMDGTTGIALAAGDTTTIVAGLADVIETGGGVASVNGATGAVVLTIAGLTSTQTVTSSATVTPVSTNDKVVVSAQAAAILFDNPSGTAAEGQGFVIALKDDGTARGITFGADFRPMGAALPTTTVLGKWMYIPVIYNATDSKWDVFAASNQA